MKDALGNKAYWEDASGGDIAVVGAVMSGAVGSTFSQIAGAAGSSLPTVAEVVTAVAAVPQAIASFAAKTAAAK